MKKYFLALLTLTSNAWLFGVNVSNSAQLQAAIISANAGLETEINFVSNMNYNIFFRPLSADGNFQGVSAKYTIQGNNATLTQTGSARGFFVAGENLSGDVITIRNLTISGAKAMGGNGGSGGGGGGAGMGGSLFVGNGANVILDNVSFINSSAKGGNAQSGLLNVAGGGGGLGGDGGSNQASGSKAGAGGGGFFGDGGSITGGSGGAGGGGSGSDGNDVSSGSTGGTGGNGFNGTGGGTGGPGNANGTIGSAGTNGGGGGGGGGGTNEPGAGGIGSFGGGGGGGGGGSTQNPEKGKNGGRGGDFGGGGASTVNTDIQGVGGDGGFGGGGGTGGGVDVGGLGGVGGFGGGGGFPDGSGGTLGGFATSTQGGGGAGLGGAIFIQNGGNLTIKQQAFFSDNSVAAGSGGVGASSLGADIFMQNGSNLTFDISATTMIPNPIKADSAGPNSGGLTKKGSGTLKLNGANTYVATTTIEGGELNLNGSVITPVTLSGGRFSGNATIADNKDLTNTSGTVAPGNSIGTINVSGNYTQGSAGTLEVKVLPNGNSDLLDIDGTATLDGTLKVLISNGRYSIGTTSTVLIASDPFSGDFSNFESPLSPFLGTPLFEYELVDLGPNDAVIVRVIQDFIRCDQTARGNAKRVRNYIRDLVAACPTVDPDLECVLQTLEVLCNPQFSNALNQLQPSPYGDLAWSNLNTSALVSSILYDRVFELACSPRGCRNPHRGNLRNNVWFSPFGEWDTHHKMGELPGFRSGSGGALLGMDHCFCSIYLGAALGYSFTDLRNRDFESNSQINRVFGGFYGCYFTKYCTTELSVFGGGNYYDSERHISFGDTSFGFFVDRTAHADHHGATLFSHAAINYSLEGARLPIQLNAEFDYVYLSLDTIKEKGADSIDLRVSQKNSHMLQTRLGLIFARSFFIKPGCWEPHLAISWVNKSPLNSGKYKASFRNQVDRFTIDTTTQSINQVSPEIGMKLTSHGGISFSAQGGADWSGRFRSLYTNVTFDFNF